MSNGERVRVLLVEDNSADAQLVADGLMVSRPPGFEVHQASRLSEAVLRLGVERFDVVLLDLGLPDAAGLSGLEAISRTAPGTAIVVRTGLSDESIAVEAIASGAQDYIVKGRPGGDEDLQRAIRYALARRQAEDTQRTLAAIVESTDDAIISKDPNGTITSWNQGAERLYGYSAGEAIGQPVAILIPPDRAGEEGKMLSEAFEGTRITHYETQRLRQDGTTVDVSLTLSPIADASGRVIGVSAIARDITERARSATALRLAEERFRRAFDEAPIGMALLDLHYGFVQVNRALCDITGYTPEQLQTTSLTAIAHPDDFVAQEGGMAALSTDDQVRHRSEIRLIHACGQPMWVALQAAVLRDADGAALSVLAQLQDITDRRGAEERLRHLADHDALTGLLNRRSFERELDAHWALTARYGGGGAAIVLDLDHFKFINDTVGHTAGDQAIARAAGVLRSRLRETDVLARLGGDEFAILLPRTDAHGARLVAEDLLESLRCATVELGRHTRSLTASAGIAMFESQEKGAEAVLMNADLAMYDAKNGGRDRAELYATDEQDSSRMKSRVTWAQRIGAALQHGGLTLLAQPIFELATRRVSQYELLLRMRDEAGDLIPPAAFLPVAERLGMVQEIDRWVTTRAIAMLADAHANGTELALEVNLSGLSIGDPDLLALVDQELARTSVPPGNLIFEVTETAAVTNMSRASRFAEDLTRLGCRFTLDDFGAGYGSFYYLKHLPFDFLKIDGEFVKGCRVSKTDRLLIKAAVDIASGMGKRTIAELVGDETTVALLTRLGVDYGQGFHLGRPAPLEITQHVPA